MNRETEIQNKELYPLLSKIDSPDDLRKLPIKDLPQVCSEIRTFLIDSLSRNPGHFASSMGAVELTVALHYVFNTPYDRIVWDVGHQAYGHKLLTGRRDRFETNRKLNGLSGFPSPEESEYDTFTAGHASNAISVALGFAVASKLKNENPKRHAVAVIGDASISGGLAFEGINNAANTQNNLLIILNDNDMSIDRNVGSLNSYLTRINTSKSYNAVRYKAYKALKKMRLVNERKRGSILRFNNSLKSILTSEQNLFEGLNIRYFGPFDGHDIGKLIRVLNDIKDMEGPKIVHLRTKKGKGFPAAEADPATWHAPGKFNPETGERPSGGSSPKPQKFQNVFGETLLEEAESNQDIVAITAAMPSGTSVATMQTSIPERVFDVGISEGHAVTFAGGLAKEGLRPVVAIYSSFLQRAYDNIIHDVAIQSLPVVFAIDRAGIVGEDGVTHHGAFDLAYMRTVPNMIVSAPRDEHQLRNLLHTALKQKSNPFAIRYPRGNGRLIDWKNTPKELNIGEGEILKDGSDAYVLSIGTIAPNVKEALERLKETENLSIGHVDMIFLKPLDEKLLKKIASTGLPIITVEDGTLNGGLGSAISDWLNDNRFANQVLRIGIPDEFIKQGTVSELQKIAGLDSETIANRIKNFIDSCK